MQDEQMGQQSRGAGQFDESHDIDELRHRIRGLQSEMEEADRRLREVVRERPFVAIAAAVAAGFLLGRILSRA